MENNYNNDELNNKVQKKLEEKIAISEFIERENKNIKNKKLKSFVGLKVASIVMLFGLIGGNVYTYATYNKEMFSWILDKIGIFDDYKDKSKEVNITITNNDISLTLTDYGIDKDTLIIGYNLKLKEKKDFVGKLIDNSNLLNGTEVFYLGDSSIELFNKINDLEYVIYKFYKIDATNLNNNVTFISDIIIYENLEEHEEKVLGNWHFDINLENDKLNLNYEEFAVKNKKVNLEQLDSQDKRDNIPTVQLLEVKKSDMTTKLVFLLDGWLTQPNDINYFVEVLDENNNVLVENNIENLIGGSPTDIIFKKIDFNSKIKINFYEIETANNNNILSKGTMVVDLSKDLIQKKSEPTKKITKQWKDLVFEYNDGAEIEQYEAESYDFIEISLCKNVGNENFINNSISIQYYKNIYKRDLNKIVEELKNLEYLGGYAISESYPVYLENNEEVILTHEKMMSLANGEKININGMEISIKDIFTHEIEYLNMENTKIDNEDAITWIKYGGSGDMERKYVFLKGDYIYEITCPTEFDTQDDVQNFINSIKIK